VVSETGVVAGQAGGYPVNSAIHDETVQPSLDTEQGLDSALGGQDVHPLAFEGAEIRGEAEAEGRGDTHSARPSRFAKWMSATRGQGAQTNWFLERLRPLSERFGAQPRAARPK
jgi:hypothetical protein